MNYHSALILLAVACAMFSAWFAGWTGWASRKILGWRCLAFLAAGGGATGAFLYAAVQLVSVPPGEAAKFGYFVHLNAYSVPLAFALGAGLLFVSAVVFVAMIRAARAGVLRARKVALDSWLHVLLSVGVVVFGVPFIWLVVTSFKEDVDMNKVPPVWVPRVQQYVKQPENPQSALVTGQYKGLGFTGAAITEFPDGRRKIRILDPPALKGQIFIARTGQVDNVRKVGLKWENYRRALVDLPPETKFGSVYLFNTLLLVALNMAGTLLASSIVAYGFARLRFPGRDAIFLMLLATLMLPGAVTMLPVFLIYRSLGWVDTLYPLWVPSFFGAAFNIFLLRQFFLTVPGELEEAARIDGCNYLQTFWSIMLPQVKPALAAIAIWTFTGTWNSFMGPLIYINSPEKMPISYALQLFQSTHGGDPGPLMAAATLVMLPVVIVFFFAQRYFIEGVTLTGMGGR